jgi:hypothetical protein
MLEEGRPRRAARTSYTSSIRIDVTDRQSLRYVREGRSEVSFPEAISFSI